MDEKLAALCEAAENLMAYLKVEDDSKFLRVESETLYINIERKPE